MDERISTMYNYAVWPLWRVFVQRVAFWRSQWLQLRF